MTLAKRAKSKKSAAKKTTSKSRTSSVKNRPSATKNTKTATAKKKTDKKVTQKATRLKTTSKTTVSAKSQNKSAIKKKESRKPVAEKIADKKKETTSKKATHKKTSIPTPSKKTKSKSTPLKTRSTTKVPENKKPLKKAPAKPKIIFPTTSLGADSVVSFEATDHLPPPELTSIAGGFVFHEDNVVLANIPGRGWEVIGGRIDHGESPEETFYRETMLQIGVSLSHLKMIGVIRIEHLGPEPPNCPYPFPLGYGVQYIGIVDELLPFNGSEESLGRSLISFDGFKEHYYDWNEYYEAVFNYAYNEYKKWRKKLKI